MQFYYDVLANPDGSRAVPPAQPALSLSEDARKPGAHQAALHRGLDPALRSGGGAKPAKPSQARSVGREVGRCSARYLSRRGLPRRTWEPHQARKTQDMLKKLPRFASQTPLGPVGP